MYRFGEASCAKWLCPRQNFPNVAFVQAVDHNDGLLQVVSSHDSRYHRLPSLLGLLLEMWCVEYLADGNCAQHWRAIAQCIERNRKKLNLDWVEAARTQAPSATNYDVGSTTWVDLRKTPLLSAMEVTILGHGPS
ncbi:unnamed protein product [Vicia faba]|uniref:Uncharacterized protein n=1 Tax=Vicia faba TaxID=3906 RepID=A0AAV1B2Q8_VICFA|nr:unnamed protein product [Vicia faba]